MASEKETKKHMHSCTLTDAHTCSHELMIKHVISESIPYI